MSKIASYLQEHLKGEVLAGAQTRHYFSHDGSVLALKPEMAVYPFNTNDVRKLARFTWQLAEKGHRLSLTPRGGGTSTTGAAIGKGVILSFPAHMNKILEVDTKQRLARVQPGVSLKTFQEAMQTHGYCLPFLVDPSPIETLGGAAANNMAGRRSIKYGTMRYWVSQLEVVLANGEVIQTGRINKRELNKKQGLATLEGEIYRQVDALILENQENITQQANSSLVNSNAGYDLADVKRKDGSFDLTPLFIGSQGTLGIITEMIVKLAPYTPMTELVVVAAHSQSDARDILEVLRSVEPAAVEMLDSTAISFAAKYQNVQFRDLLPDDSIPAALLFIEFDGAERTRKRDAKRVEKALTKAGHMVVRSEGYDDQEKMWQVYHNAVTALTYGEQTGREPIPVIDDATIPTDQLEKYLQAVAALGKKYHGVWPVWGQAAEGRFRVMPFLDLRKVGDRQKIAKMLDEYSTVIAHLGGSIASASGEGRLGVPFGARIFGEEMAKVYADLKEAFDPHMTLNPGVKTGTDLKDLVSIIGDSYAKANLNYLRI